jgi:predicted ABC-type transport system involved in lysophospholipase L1 biosynthesis ATPase subunit
MPKPYWPCQRRASAHWTPACAGEAKGMCGRDFFTAAFAGMMNNLPIFWVQFGSGVKPMPISDSDVSTREIAEVPARQRPLVRIRDVSKTYQNGTIALSDVSLDIAHGEFVSLIGPSGCGKSTLLRLIAELGQVSSGTIEWPPSRRDAGGEPIRDLGFVFQDPTLMPWATVAANVYLPLKLSGVTRRAAASRIDNALAMVKLGSFAQAYPRELSGGMNRNGSCLAYHRGGEPAQHPADVRSTSADVTARHRDLFQPVGARIRAAAQVARERRWPRDLRKYEEISLEYFLASPAKAGVHSAAARPSQVGGRPSPSLENSGAGGKMGPGLRRDSEGNIRRHHL